MRVLLSGGSKTNNILAAIQPRFKSGVEFTIENNIADIPKFLGRGDYFDRAIVMEQSWTEDDTILDEVKIRDGINSFIQTIRERFRNFEIVFVTSSEEMAKIVLEESIDITVYSTVILKKLPFYASFFTDLITLDIHKMPEKYIFDLKKAAGHIDAPTNIDKIMWSDEDSIEKNDAETGPLLEPAKSVNINIGNKKDAANDGKKDTTDKIGNTCINKELNNTNIDISSLESNINTGQLNDGEELDADEEDDSVSFDDLDDGFFSFDGDDNGFDDEEDIEEDNSNTEGDGNGAEEGNSNIEWDNSVTDEDGSSAEEDADIGIDDIFGDALDIDNAGSLFDSVGTNKLYETGNDSIETKKDDKLAIEKQEQLFDMNDSEENNPVKIEEEVIPVDANIGLSDGIEQSEDEQIDFGGIAFKGIKGRGIRGKSKYKAPLNKKDALDDAELKTVLNTFLKRGNALTVTGGRCSGKTTIANNLANIVAKMEYTVLLVDMDVHWRGQAYINKDIYDTVHSSNTSKESLRKAVNSTNSEIGRYVDIIRPGFHLLTTGLGCDIEPVGEIINAKRLSRFIHSAKTSYNFIIFDVPFESLTTDLADVLFATDDLLMCVDTSNHGLMEFLLNMSNIDSEEVKDTLFGMSQIIFNKVTKVENVFGYKVKTVRQVLRAMDMQVKSLIGGEGEYLFADMKICNVLKYNPLFEKCWFSRYQISDFTDGERIFIDMLRKVLVKN